MSRSFIKGLVCIITFIVSLFVISAVMNRGNTDMTMEMSEASYPLVYINHEGQYINCLHGYSNEMDVAFMRDTITPLADDRQISLYIDKYNNDITSVGYEVRSLNGERLIENAEIFNYKERENGILADIVIKDLIDSNTEYEFVVILGTSSGKTIRYYTRIVQRSEDYAGDEIRFALDFHEKTFDKEAARELAKYLETDDTGDNTTYSYVNIHNSFAQITWGDLHVERISVPQVHVMEYFDETMRVKLSYYVNVRTEDGERKCRVEEFYRMRYGTERIYLLDFERTMTEVFEMEIENFNNNKIDLGIRNGDVNFMESEDGGVFAFVSENRLFCYNSSNNRFAMLFGFYDKDNADERTYYDQNDIEILNVDETGNVEFMVYGYMNRGTHEGNMGVAVYYYNSVSNTIEEQVFIPYDRSFTILSGNLNQLTYLNNRNELFLYLSGNIFCVKLDEKRYEIIVENLPQGSLKVSRSHQMIVWPQGDDVNRSTSLALMDLNSRRILNVEAGANNYIRPLGFMDEDLIYGLIRQTDLYMDRAGSLVHPMFCVNISKGSDNTVTMQYQKPDIYVTDIVIEDNQITLERVSRSTDSNVYIATSPDQIMSTEIQLRGENTVSVVATENLQKIVQIAAKSNFVTKSLKFMTPQEVMYEGGHEVALLLPEQIEEKYYVYGADGITGIYSDEADAVNDANINAGTVINENGDYVWIKGNRLVRNQIMKIEATQTDEKNSSLAVCLNTMLEAEGITKNSQYLLNQGESALSILNKHMPESTQILELGGCSLDSVLYYVNRDIPVMAIMQDGSAVLIIGFNELNTVIMDPSTGQIYKKGMNDSKNWFENNGNQFIAYIN